VPDSDGAGETEREPGEGGHHHVSKSWPSAIVARMKAPSRRAARGNKVSDADLVRRQTSHNVYYGK
jgi:hypothetical protein